MRRHVHVWLDAFEESDHPRDKEGKFAAAHGASEGENEPLNPEEKDAAVRRLGSLQKHPHPWGENYSKSGEMIVKPEDVRFHHVPGHLTIAGVRHTGPRWGTVRRVPVHLIERGQSWIPERGLKSYIENINSNPEMPELVHTKGETVHRVVSGHTRIGAQALAGRRSIRARVYEQEQDPRHPKDPPRQIRPGR